MKAKDRRTFGVTVRRPVGAAAAGLTAAAGCAAMLLSPGAAKAGFLNGMKLCAVTLLPALLPFMILSSFFLHLTIAYAHASSGMLRLLRLPKSCFFAVLFSMVGGYPVGAALTATLLREQQITPPQARRMLCFCVCPGPAFVMSAVGVDLLQSRRAGVLLYVSTVLSALLLGVLTAIFTRQEPQPVIPLKETHAPPVGLLLSAAVDESARSMLSVCGWVCFCSSLLGLLAFVRLPAAADLTLSVVFEVTSGAARCAGTVPLPALAAILGWGGVCTHFQVLGPLTRAQMPLGRFMAFRLLHALLCAGVCAGLLYFFPVTKSVMLPATQPPVPSHSASFSVGAGILSMCLLLLIGNERLIFRRRLEKSAAV